MRGHAMATDFPIPAEAICHVCGKPMRVIRSEGLAAAMGFKVPEGQIVTIECCDHQLRIEDEEVKSEVVSLLEASHARGQETVSDESKDYPRTANTSLSSEG